MSNEENAYLTIGVIVGLLAGVILTLIVYSQTTAAWKKESVELGHAYWTVRANGDTEWHWKTNCVEKP